MQNLALLLSDDLADGNTSFDKVLDDADLSAVTLRLELARGRFFNASAAVKEDTLSNQLGRFIGLDELVWAADDHLVVKVHLLNCHLILG